MNTLHRVMILVFFASILFIIAISKPKEGAEASLGSPFMLKDINLTGDSDAQNFVFVHDKLYFLAFDGDSYAIWKSDGTEEGTVKFRDGGHFLTKFNNYLIFYDNQGIWRSDGTESGTILLQETCLNNPHISASTAQVNGEFYFVTCSWVSDAESLWKTDGTPEGTIPSPATDSTNITSIVASNHSLFFTTDVYKIYPPPSGNLHRFSTVWQTDGTENGTVMVKEWLGTLCDLQLIHAFDGIVYFGAAQICLIGFAEYTGFEFWRTDGTDNGTYLLMDPVFNQIFLDYGFNASSINNKHMFLFYPFYFEPSKIRFLFSTDGTSEGTIFINEGTNSSQFIKPDLENLYVTGSTGLWRLDGTNEGTELVKGFASGAWDGTSIAGALFFFAATEQGDYELWQSDGTNDGTVMVADIGPEGASTPHDLINGNGFLFFVADDGTNGSELWGMDYIDLDYKILFPFILQTTP